MMRHLLNLPRSPAVIMFHAWSPTSPEGGTLGPGGRGGEGGRGEGTLGRVQGGGLRRGPRVQMREEGAA